MLRPELDRLGEIALEVVDALARDAVDQVERDVVEAGVAEVADTRARTSSGLACRSSVSSR